MLEQLHFVLGVVWVKVQYRQKPHCSVELKRIVTERGRRSRGGHLCIIIIIIIIGISHLVAGVFVASKLEPYPVAPEHFLQYKVLGEFPYQPFYLPHQPFGN